MRHRLISALLTATAAFLLLAACSGHDEGSGQQARERCLYAAEDAYPTWANTQPVLDSIEPCKNLSQADKTALRKLMTDFVAATEAKREGH